MLELAADHHEHHVPTGSLNDKLLQQYLNEVEHERHRPACALNIQVYLWRR